MKSENIAELNLSWDALHCVLTDLSVYVDYHPLIIRVVPIEERITK